MTSGLWQCPDDHREAAAILRDGTHESILVIAPSAVLVDQDGRIQVAEYASEDLRWLCGREHLRVFPKFHSLGKDSTIRASDEARALWGSQGFRSVDIHRNGWMPEGWRHISFSPLGRACATLRGGVAIGDRYDPQKYAFERRESPAPIHPRVFWGTFKSVLAGGGGYETGWEGEQMTLAKSECDD